MKWTDGLGAAMASRAGQRTAPTGCRVIACDEIYGRLYGARAALPEDDPNKVDLSRVRTFIITTSRVAKDDGVLLPDGMDATDFMRRPIVGAMHEGKPVGVGRGLGLRRISEPEDGWALDVEFPPAEASREGDEIFRWLDWAGFGSCSAGFRITVFDNKPSADEIVRYGLPRYGWIGRKWKLWEVSICGVPADEGALMLATRAGVFSDPEAASIARRNGLRWCGRMEEMPAEPDPAAAPGGDVLQEMRAGFAALAQILTEIKTSLAGDDAGEEGEDETDGAGAPEDPAADGEGDHAGVGTGLYDQVLGEHLKELETKLGVSANA